MKTLDEYRKELEQDPKARRTLKKLEKEFREVEANLTEEELVKYGLRQSPEEKDEKDAAASENAAASVIDSISRKI